MRQPDIEIYLKDADQQAIAAWLSEAIGPCSEWRQQGQTFKCRAGEVPVTWLPKAVGKWHSLYLESDATPWSDDLACARAAFAARKYFNFSTVIPCHYRTFPLLEQNAAALKAGLPKAEVIEPEVLVPISL